MATTVICCYLLIVSAIHIIAAADEVDDVEKDPAFIKCVASGVGGDIKTAEDLEKNPESEKALCFTKCFVQEKGYIAKDGTVDIETIMNQFEKLPLMPVSVLGSIKQCLKKIGKIVECKDVGKLQDCIEG